jgi:hypothetical protein
MAHSVQTFNHSALNIAKDEIRLACLLPSCSSDEIECELFIVNLEVQPFHEALSYEWGPPSQSSFWITIDGKLCSVRENLWHALRSLRKDSQPRVLLIDTLCINKDDSMESSHQVTHMGEIYRNAERVIVWVGREQLGSLEEETSTATTFLEDVRQYEITEFLPTRVSSPGMKTSESNSYGRAWRALLHFCRRSY